MKKRTWVTLTGLLLLALPVSAGINLLHEFAGDPGSAALDGMEPYGSLIRSGSFLYGMTRNGGGFYCDSGMVFRINMDGSGFTRLHVFNGGAADGRWPHGSLVISGSTLYGMTAYGGDSDGGTIFKIETNGSGFALVHEFAGGAADGQRPYGSLIISSSTLYGMTYAGGGGSDFGTIFKIQTNGAGFTVLHVFVGGDDDGLIPKDSLVLSGSTLYGMTTQGGPAPNGGTIFKIGTNGNGFTLLHKFANNAANGAYPYGSLIISGSTLFGMTSSGGDSLNGTIFKVQTDGTGFALLHEFAGGAADGSAPLGSLILSGSTLYGMTRYGGNGEMGAIFKIQTDGSGFALRHKFAGGAADGKWPEGSLIISGSTLFGMTRYGGDLNKGVVFSLPLPGMLVDHTCNEITQIPEAAVLAAKQGLHIAYGHTSHGSQLITGMDGLVPFMNSKGYTNDLYAWNEGGTEDALDIRDDALGGDVGYYPDWVNNTHSYLGAVNASGRGAGNPDINVIIWSWCGQASGLSEQQMIDNYLTPMTNLENEYFGIKFVYMTGHLDGSGSTGNLAARNDQIRDYCSTNKKILYDFADIESYDPDGLINYMPLLCTDNCDYDSDGDGTTDKNWALDWQNSHTENVDWYDCSPAHSQALNGNLKAYAAWWLWAKLGGWSLSAEMQVQAPNGGENWTVGSSHDITWTSSGVVGNVDIIYSTNNGSNWTSITADTANDGSYTWIVPDTPSTTCYVQVLDHGGNPYDSSDAVFTISSAAAETVSTPSQPTGANSGLKATSYPFTTGGSTSSQGHTVQYKFDWDDGTDSGWLAEGTTTASHSWVANGTYDVRAMARCVTHTTIESLWSTTHAITISDSGTLEKYNSPSQQKILPEVIWASATGGGTWMSEVQVTDLSGGSQVSVYYNTSAGRRGPFVLWNNGGGALRSQKYNNLLETIDGLDSGIFTYYGTVGAVEFVSQDAAHVLQVMARTLNSSYSKTFPAFSLHDANTADTGRAMVITNLTSNSNYRSTVGFFNPTADSVTMNLKLRDAANAQIGATITKAINGHGFSAFFPFNEAGVAYPANSYDNVVLEIQPTSGTGKVLCFGASANNVTNDPAAHLAVQNSAGHDNGPSSLQILPEAIWAAATGGGTWMSEVQIVDISGGSVVSVYFDYGSGNRRGPFVLWTGSVAGSKVKYANILQQIGTIDSGFTYYGRVGTVEFRTQDGTHYIQVTARTLNGDYSKTFPGLNLVDAETADTSRIMLIQNYASNSTYRSTSGFFNPTGDAVTVEFTLLNGSGTQVGTPFSRTFVGYDYQAFFPFTEAGVPYPANSFDNVILRVRPTSGTGQVVCFGASANNASNDPAAHLAVQGQ